MRSPEAMTDRHAIRFEGVNIDLRTANGPGAGSLSGEANSTVILGSRRLRGPAASLEREDVRDGASGDLFAQREVAGGQDAVQPVAQIPDPPLVKWWNNPASVFDQA